MNGLFFLILQSSIAPERAMNMAQFQRQDMTKVARRWQKPRHCAPSAMVFV
jgi:hypothetical protein